MDANNRSANEVSEHLRLQNEQLETENKALRKKIGEQANQLKRLDNNQHLPPCPVPAKPKVPVSRISFVKCRLGLTNYPCVKRDQPALVMPQ